MANIIKKFVENEKRELNRLSKIANKVLSYENNMSEKTDEQLREKTDEFKKRYQNGESLDDLLPEAFALVREGAKRVLGLHPYKVQVMGGVTLHEGNVAEMRTGEGKTLTATMPVYLNALTGEGVHVVTVNEYLSTRDAKEMGELYEFLGLTVGLNLNAKTPDQKREAYACDITYSTNNELGFDYLRDNMVTEQRAMVQRPLNFAVVDEVDSILIDEARTPLIISGEAEKSTAMYLRADFFVKGLKAEEDYEIDLQSKTVSLTDTGISRAELVFHIENLYDVDNTLLVHHIDQALRANYIMMLDVDYVVDTGEVKIVDPFTGRVMDGRRYSDGLHQAIEAKEGVNIQNESKTMATITFQNYFRMYKKLSGCTGTAKTEEEELREIYNMQVTPIPTNRPIARIDAPDLLYPTLKSKFRAVVADIKERHAKGQPILVGTVAVETSELLSNMLVAEGVPHEVLNAKNHAKEAEIIISAGQKGAVTIATNMAGRGTDIKLGKGVKELGGLCVIGTERHESRRIDNQLRGRSGRQGDIGESQFYLSLQDDLMKRFGNDRTREFLTRLTEGQDEDIVIQSKMFTRQVESAQKRVEGNNYDARKNVLEYDEVMREQREIIYSQRQQVIREEESLEDTVKAMINRTIIREVEARTATEQKNWDLDGLFKFATNVIVSPEKITLDDLNGKTSKQLIEYLQDLAMKIYIEKMEILQSPEYILQFEKLVILRVVDQEWTSHIDEMDHLRQGVGLRSYAQTNPLTEYQNEGFERFNAMINNIEFEVSRIILKANIKPNVE